VALAVIFYGCWHYFLLQNVNINPECLCIAGSTVILFLLVKYIEYPKASTAFLIGFFPLALIMLKPVYLIVLSIVLLFLLGRFVLTRGEKKILYWGALGWLAAVAGVLGYCEMNKKRNGQFVLSKVQLNNSLANIVISGAYKYGGDKEFIAVIDTNKGKWFYTSVFYLNNEFTDSYAVRSKAFPFYLPPTKDMKFCQSIPDTINYSYERISLFVKKSKHTMYYWKYIFNRATGIILSYKKIFGILFVETIFCFYVFIKQRKMAWIESLCILFVLGQFSVVILGGIDDIERLLIPGYPFIIILSTAFFGLILSFLDKIMIARPTSD
jgi:hypothetical protein